MKKYLLLLITVFFLPVIVKAKEIDINLIASLGGNYGSEFYDVEEVEDGYVVIGESTSTESHLFENKEYHDSYIIKYDKRGNIVWKNNFAGNNDDYFRDVEKTLDGGYIVVGCFYSSDIEDMPNHGHHDGIIMKFDKDGNLIWRKNYGGNGFDYFENVVLTSDGGFIIAGLTTSTDIKEIVYNGGTADGLVVKYDKDGNIVWQKNVGGNGYDYFLGGVESSEDGIIAVGYTGSSNISGITTNGYDGYIVKIDKDGNTVWQKNYGGNNTDYFRNIASNDQGVFAVVGFSQSTDMEEFENKGGRDAVIIQFDKDGNFIWDNYYSGNANDFFIDVTVAKDGVIVAGYTKSTDIENTPNFGEEDISIIKYDFKGNVEWQKSYGGNGTDFPQNIIMSNNGNCLVAGYSSSTDIEGLVNTTENNAYNMAILFSIDVIYDIEKVETDEGQFEVTQDGDKGKIEVNPNEGYEVDEIIIIDSLGLQIDYYEENGSYYFEFTDDVKVQVKFKKIINPSTGIFNPYVVLSIMIIITSSIVCLSSKKKYI